ncbi:hypothetical protein [Massilia cavernae]|uniref:Uncharacterized protein n=1 Tax=Massilia cavernae TaxID=2320864 RepID=A0A418Y6U8_9BURK|nr:hypothetical protein [Massilia cavernae]RJG24685.1 hypothetical protein D3872_03405 [Massilia cavernae]
MQERPDQRVATVYYNDKEKRCSSCGEYWPADKEFFAEAISGTDGLARRCRACVKERVWAFVPTTDG